MHLPYVDIERAVEGIITHKHATHLKNCEECKYVFTGLRDSFATFLPGEFIGRYQVLSFLGRGAEGPVYLCRDSELSRNVAIKCLRERQVPQGVVPAKVDHQAVIKVLDFGIQEEIYYLVFEHADGASLCDYVFRNEAEIRDVFERIADGLHAIHTSGHAHGDVKARNVIITSSGPKILDFGLASSVLGLPRGGSLGYQAPEATDMREIDLALADQFAFGVMLSDVASESRLRRIAGRCTRSDPRARFCSMQVVKQRLSIRKRSAVVMAVTAGVALFAGVLLYTVLTNSAAPQTCPIPGELKNWRKNMAAQGSWQVPQTIDAVCNLPAQKRKEAVACLQDLQRAQETIQSSYKASLQERALKSLPQPSICLKRDPFISFLSIKEAAALHNAQMQSNKGDLDAFSNLPIDHTSSDYYKKRISLGKCDSLVLKSDYRNASKVCLDAREMQPKQSQLSLDALLRLAELDTSTQSNTHERAQTWLEAASQLARDIEVSPRQEIRLLEARASLLLFKGDERAALQLYQQAVDKAKELLGTDHPNYWFKYIDYQGRRLSTTEAWQSAENIMLAAIEVQRLLGEEHPATHIARHQAAIGFTQTNQPLRAIEVLSPVKQKSADDLALLCMAHATVDSLPTAKAYCVRSEKMRADPREAMLSLSGDARLVLLKKTGAAARKTKEIYEVRARELGDDNLRTIAALHQHAIVLSRKDSKAALALLEAVKERYKRNGDELGVLQVLLYERKVLKLRGQATADVDRALAQYNPDLVARLRQE